MPRTLRSIQLADTQLAELTMLCGLDDDLAKQATATSNRIRGLLTQLHPTLVRVLGPQLAQMLADIRQSRDTVSPRSKPSWRPTLFTRS